MKKKITTELLTNEIGYAVANVEITINLSSFGKLRLENIFPDSEWGLQRKLVNLSASIGEILFTRKYKNKIIMNSKSLKVTITYR